jgi:serine/threonine protein kinase
MTKRKRSSAPQRGPMHRHSARDGVLSPAELPDVFWASLQSLYKDAPSTDPEWALTRALVTTLSRTLTSTYEVIEPAGLGGTSLVLKVSDRALASLQTPHVPVFRALKVPRPIPARLPLLSSLLQEEARTLAGLTHSHLVKLYYAGVVTLDLNETLLRDAKPARTRAAAAVQTAIQSIPFYIMDFIEGSATLGDYVSRPETTFDHFVRLLKDAAGGLAFLFSNTLAHNDVKPSNVLVNHEGRALIADLGSVTSLASPRAEALFTTTPTYAHPDKLKRAYGTQSDQNRARVKVFPEDPLLIWDLFSLGLTILELTARFFATHPQESRPYQQKYLLLLGARLLDGHPHEHERVLGLTRGFYLETRYRSIAEMMLDLEKLTGEFRLSSMVPEMNLHSQDQIQTGMYSGTTSYTPALSAILDHPIVRRLASTTQLGFISLVYPTATHTRYEHSLGTYSNAIRIVDALWHDSIVPVFRQIMRPADIRHVLLAALLHDLGQYPLAHDLEEAEKSLFDHEAITLKLLDVSMPLASTTLRGLLDELYGAGTTDGIVAILRADPDVPGMHTFRDRVLHTIIDGPIDADKLDYLARDSARLNVRYGSAIDFDRLLASLTVAYEPMGDKLYGALGIHAKGRIAAEAVAFARYAMFGSVYWHHTVRAMKAMLQRAVWEWLKDSPGSGRATIREDFQRVIVENRLPAVQPALFGPTRDALETPVWPTLAPTDLQMLAWVWQNTSENGRYLIEGIVNRRFYKRMLAVAAMRSSSLYKKLVEFVKQARADEWCRLAESFQDRLVELVTSLDGSERKKSLHLGEEAVASFVERARGNMLILVDVPGSRTDGMHELKYLPEIDRWAMKTEYDAPGRLQDSEIWSALVEKFDAAIGTARVFVHPDYRTLLTALVKVSGRERIEGELELAIKQAGKPAGPSQAKGKR